MGLDMWLHKRPKVEDEITYWRKANQIRGWFANNVDNFEDNGETVIPKEKVKELLTVCDEVLKHRSEKYSKEVLPVTSGFFFGSEEYDDDYYDEVAHTAEVLRDVLYTVDFDRYDLVYSEWY